MSGRELACELKRRNHRRRRLIGALRRLLLEANRPKAIPTEKAMTKIRKALTVAVFGCTCIVIGRPTPYRQFPLK